MFLPKKILESKIANPKKYFDHPCLLKSREPSLGSYIKLHIHIHHYFEICSMKHN